MRIQETTFLLLWILSLCLCSCGGAAGLNSAQKTNQLRPGMTYQEVVGILGEPESSQTAQGKWIVRWSLHEYWKGWVPYDMVFDPNKKTLIAWSANEQEYQKTHQQQMQQWGQKGGTTTPGGSGGAPAATAGGSDPQLMRQMAGNYYSFSSAGLGYSGGTERKVTLCPNGTYYMATESGYSGGAGTAGAWGTASQGGGRGTWRIEGNLQQGTIVTVDQNGKATTYRYQRCGSDCVYFGNNKFAYAGPASCP